MLNHALDALILKLEKRKFAATAKPRPGRRRSTRGGRYIPADVKRTVWVRDGGQCTFVSEAGNRCPARAFLEFDHVDEVARGGQATAERMRLRCRAHNQYQAERTFGTEFMSHKRQEARRAAAEARAQAAATEQAKERDVVPWLRRLGFRADEARHAAALCETIPDAALEERVRVALSFFHSGPCPRPSREEPGVGGSHEGQSLMPGGHARTKVFRNVMTGSFASFRRGRN